MAEEPTRIVYVDDDLELTRMVQNWLTNSGHEVIVANDGEEGLGTILSQQPDLVILDVMMPGMTGWEILKYLRSKPDWATTPVIMLTGIGATLNAMTSPLYGASAQLDKPFDLDELDALVTRLLTEVETAESKQTEA